MDPTHTQDPDDSLDESLYADDPASASPPQDVRRGPSVKSRASTYEQSLSGHSSAGLGLDSERPKSRAASPFRLPPSPGLHGLDVPRHEQHRPPSAGRSRSPMRLPASPGHRSPSPAHYAPRASSPLKMLQPLHSHSGHHTGLEPPSPSNAPSHSSRELPHSPCGTMPDLPFECPTSTPRRKRVPVPAEASAQVSPSPKVARGDSSARRMIAQWENGIQEPPSTVRGLEAPGSPSPRRPMPQGYLNDKPLPIPTATAIPASSNMPWPPPSSSRAPPGGLQMPQPLRGERTPNSKPDHMSPSSWSPVQRGKRSENAKSDWSAALSPSKSSGKSPMKRSPFKDIVNKFTGRKKDKEPSYDSSTGAGPQSQRFISLDDDKEWFAQSLPANGGVGFSDRMGDEEMAPAPWYDRDVSNPYIQRSPSGHSFICRPLPPSYTSFIGHSMGIMAYGMGDTHSQVPVHHLRPDCSWGVAAECSSICVDPEASTRVASRGGTGHARLRRGAVSSPIRGSRTRDTACARRRGE